MTPEERERRAAVLGLLALVWVAILVVRLLQLQVWQGSQFAAEAQGVRIRMTPIVAPRGEMLDRRGRVLVGSRPAFSALYFRLGHPPSAQEVRVLARILGESPAQLRHRIDSYRGLPYEPVPLKQDLTPQEFSAILERRLELPGVSVQAQALRAYFLGPVGASVFGYVGQVQPWELNAWHDPRLTPNSVVGQAGLELEYQKYLQGTDGGQEVEVNASGEPVRVLGTVPPVPGDNLVLTLSARLEKVATVALAKQMAYLRATFHSLAPAVNGAVVVLNVHTGQVLAMTSLPSYDPNWFADGLTPAESRYVWGPEAPTLNRAIYGQYAPGSTYKMAVAVAGLMEGKITPKTIVPGVVRYWYPPYPWNWCRCDVGPNDLAKAIAQSYDIYFYELGRKLGLDGIARYAKKFGFGRRLGIDLPGEMPGLVPTDAYEIRKNGAVWPGLRYIAAIGQGDDLVTLLQLAHYTAMLATDGVGYRPYLVQEIRSPTGKVLFRRRPEVDGRVRMPAAYWRAIHQGMHGATVPGPIPGNGGTAGAAFAGFPMKVAGKTGTAQYGNNLIRAFFVSYAPYRHPQIAVAVMVTGGGEGADVAVVARTIYDAYFHLKDPTNPMYHYNLSRAQWEQEILPPSLQPPPRPKPRSVVPVGWAVSPSRG